MKWLLGVCVVACGSVAWGQEAEESAWEALRGRTFYDLTAFAGATYVFGEDEQVVGFEVHGSGVRTIARGKFDVRVEGELVWFEGGQTLEYDAEADVLLYVGQCGARLVPTDGLGMPREAPLLDREGFFEAPELPTQRADEVGRLIELLDGHEDALVRREALVVLVHRCWGQDDGDKHAALRRALADEDPEVRAYAVWGLQEVRAAQADELERALTDESAQVRREAARALGRWEAFEEASRAAAGEE